jgi:erythromycin esterase
MDRFKRSLCVAGLSVALALGASARGESFPPEPMSVAPPGAVVAFVADHRVPIGGPETPLDAPEAGALNRIVAGADVIGFGENGHGSEEPLAYRNRLIRHLVEYEGFTAVALESGLANTRRVGDWVAGGAGDPAQLVRDNLSWGFGALQANLDMVRWLRAYNLAHPSRPVRLYGADAAVRLVLRTSPSLEAEVSLDDTIDYLDHTLTVESADVRRRLATYRGRFTSTAYAGFSPAERRGLDAALSDAESLIRENKARMIAASSDDAYAWAAREATDARSLPALLGARTLDPTQLDKLRTAIEVRDRVMAQDLLWVLAREGPRGRVLMFAAHGHVAGAPMVGSVMRLFKDQPATMGTLVKARLGDRYRVILTASPRTWRE